VVARYTGRARGPVTAEVEIANGSAQATRRAFRIRL
jgi:hypothetical protein